MVAYQKNNDVEKFIDDINEFKETNFTEESFQLYQTEESSFQYNKLITIHEELVNNKRKRFDGFKSRLRNSYKSAFPLMEIFLELYREFGDYYGKRYAEQADSESNYLFRAFNLMYARSCQVGQEIFVLMENGYADGAYARWRTIHEITIFAYLIKDNGNGCAKRFLDFSAVEEYNEAQNYKTLEEKYKFPKVDKVIYERIDEEYQRVVKEYGEDYKKTYGWASNILKTRERNIHEIAKIVRLESDSGYYKLACNNIHSGSKSLFWRLGSLDGKSTLAGATDFGHADAGINTVRSLYKLSTLFLTTYPNSKALIVIMLLNKLLEGIETQLLKCQKAIEDNF